MKKRKSRAVRPMTKVGICTLLFIVLLAIYGKVSRDGLPSGITSMFDHPLRDYLDTRQFDDSTKSEMQKKLSGFRQGSGQGIWSGHGPYSLDDRIEIKDNGYIWRVTRYRIEQPAENPVELQHIVSAYMMPYGVSRQAQSQIVRAEVRIIRQVWITPGDTCYGPSHEDVIWDFKTDSDGLDIQGVTYTMYDGRLDTMFPSGSLKLVDEIRIKACPTGTDVALLALQAVATRLGSTTVDSLPVQDAAEIFDRWYAPFFGEYLTDDTRAGTKETEIRFTITSNGTVADLVISNPRISRNTSLLNHARMWRFPPAGQTRPPVTVTRTIVSPATRREDHGPAQGL